MLLGDIIKVYLILRTTSRVVATQNLLVCANGGTNEIPFYSGLNGKKEMKKTMKESTIDRCHSDDKAVRIYRTGIANNIIGICDTFNDIICGMLIVLMV